MWLLVLKWIVQLHDASLLHRWEACMYFPCLHIFNSSLSFFHFFSRPLCLQLFVPYAICSLIHTFFSQLLSPSSQVSNLTFWQRCFGTYPACCPRITSRDLHTPILPCHFLIPRLSFSFQPTFLPSLYLPEFTSLFNLLLISKSSSFPLQLLIIKHDSQGLESWDRQNKEM